MATLSSLVVNLQANTGQYQRGMRGASRNADSVRKSVVRLGATLAGIFGARQLLRGMRSISQAFTIQEDAVQGLRASLIVTGKDGVASLAALTRSAAELQKVTRAGDEAIIAATASMALLAPALDTQALQDSQEAIIGIAETFTKGDFEAAALLIGKSVGSTTNALTRYGIVIDTTATQQEKMAQVLQQSSNFFEVAKARALTTSGAMAQLVNAFGDVKEAIGEMLATKSGFTQFLQRVTTTLADVATILSGSAPQIERMFGLIGIIAGNAFSVAVATAFVDVPRAFRDMFAEMAKTGPRLLFPINAALAESAEGWRLILEGFFSGIRGEARASITGAVLELGEMAKKIEALAPVVAAGASATAAAVKEGVTAPIVKELSTIEQAGVAAGESLIRGFIQGTDNLTGLLVSVMKQIATQLIIGKLNEALENKSPSKAAARAGQNTVLGYIKGLKDSATAIPAAVGGAFALPSGPSPAFAGGVGGGAGAGGGTIVNQEIHFNMGFVDGGSGQAWLKANGSTIAQIIFDAAQDGAGFRRGLRGR